MVRVAKVDQHPIVRQRAMPVTGGPSTSTLQIISLLACYKYVDNGDGASGRMTIQQVVAGVWPARLRVKETAHMRFRSDAEGSASVVFGIVQARAIRWGDVEDYQAPRRLSRLQETDVRGGNAGNSPLATALVSRGQLQQTVP